MTAYTVNPGDSISFAPGPAGPMGPQGPQGVPGPAGNSASVPMICGPTPDATGSGAANLAALTAFYDAVSKGSAHGVLPAGDYPLSAPLTIVISGATSNFTIEGAGKGATNIIAPAGPYVMGLPGGRMWRGARFKGFSLVAGSKANLYASPVISPAGLSVSDCSWSAASFEDVEVANVGIAFNFLGGGGADGEQAQLVRCNATNCDTFLLIENGQSYATQIIGGGIGARVGATVFKIATKSGGGGVVISGFDASPYIQDQTKPSNILMFSTGQSNSPITVVGGRWENVTHWAIGESGVGIGGQAVIVNAYGLDMTTDFAPGFPGLRYPAWVTLGVNDNGGNVCEFSFDGCTIAGGRIAGAQLTFDTATLNARNGRLRIRGGNLGYAATCPPLVTDKYFGYATYIAKTTAALMRAAAVKIDTNFNGLPYVQ